MTARERRLLLTAVTATAVVVAPVYLLGGLSALIRADLRFDERALGFAASAFFASSAVWSVPAGWAGARLGARRALMAGVTLGIVPFVAIALLVSSWWQVVVCMVLAGGANTLTQLAVNLSLARGIRHERQGLAFGVKQAAVPLTTLLVGLAVPAFGLTLGWRAAFVVAAVTGAGLLPALRLVPQGSPAAAARARTVDLARVRLLAPIVFAAGCATATANAAGTFFIESAVRLGYPVSVAGLVFSTASLAGIAGRVGTGWGADHSTADNFRIMGWMMVTGSAGYVAIAWGRPLPVLALGLFVAFIAGWGWAGLLHMSVIRENPDAPAQSTGITHTGIFVGGIVGPAGFGAIATAFGYRAAWATAALVILLGGTVMLHSRRRRHGLQGSRTFTAS